MISACWRSLWHLSIWLALKST